MKCFQFSNGEKKEGSNPRRSSSSRSYSTTSTDREMRKSGSEFSSDMNSNSFGRSPFPSFSDRPNNLRVFTFSELKSATRNFSRALMIGEGGFGCVYRGIIRSSEDPSTKIDVAIKQLSRRGLQGHKEWLTEVSVLDVVEHPNLVELVGYCAEDDERGIQRLLVYEFMPNRSVQDHLLSRTSAPLSWNLRLRIAVDAARGLTYLHEEMGFQIIFRDLKTSNILLDENWNAKLSDFGLAREGPTEGLSHVSTAVVGTLGYAAPEYILTGRLTSKSDIWSYGVVLYELITGRRPMDANRPKSEQKLLEWVKPYTSDSRKIWMIIDPRLEGQVSSESAMRLASVASKCLIKQAKARPKMSQVLEMVQGIVEDLERGFPQVPPRINTLKKVTSNEKKGVDWKRRAGDPKMGEGRRLVWMETKASKDSLLMRRNGVNKNEEKKQQSKCCCSITSVVVV